MDGWTDKEAEFPSDSTWRNLYIRQSAASKPDLGLIFLPY